jgi:hypothetical protein
MLLWRSSLNNYSSLLDLLESSQPIQTRWWELFMMIVRK